MILHNPVARFCGVRLCLRGSMNQTKKGSVADSDLQSEGDNPKMDSENVLSEEEVWELFA